MKLTMKLINILFSNLLHQRSHSALLLRYIISGLFVGLIYVYLGYFLLTIVGVNTPASITLAYIVTTPLAFFLHKKFTFKSDSSLTKEIPRFILVGFLLFLLSSLSNKYITVSIYPLLQIGIFWILGSLLNFLAYRFWVFNSQS